MTKHQPSARLADLMRRATEAAGNQSKLAILIAESKTNVNAWAQGSRSCPVEAQVLMAGVCGDDPDRVMKEAFIERNQGTPKGEMLLFAMGKDLLKRGAATALTLCVFAASGSLNGDVLRCIKSQISGRNRAF